MRSRFLAVALLFLVFGLQCLFAVRENSLANDEAKHIVTGYLLLKARTCCLGMDNSPGTALFALPLLVLNAKLDPSIRMGAHAWEAGSSLLFGSPSPESMLAAARLMTVLCGFLCLFAAARWSERLFGPGAGLLTLALLAFDPNCVAHFSLVSPDALLAATAVVAGWRLEEAWRRPTPANTAIAGAALGAVALAKYTGFALVGAAAVLWPLAHVQALKDRGSRFWASRTALAAVVCVGVVWLGYGAHVSADPPFFGFPGLREGIARARDYATHGMLAFFNGELGQAWRAYFPEAFAIKTPIPLLILYLVTALVMIASRPRPTLKQIIPLGLAAVVFSAGVAGKLDIGLRLILPVFPLLAIQCGAIVPRLVTAGRPRAAVWIVTCVLLAWLAAESLFICPNGIAYFNEFVGGPRNGWKYLGDSNVDWGQDLKRLKKEMQRLGLSEVILSYAGSTPPEFYGIRYQYLPPMFRRPLDAGHVVGREREVLAVSVRNIQGIFTPRERRQDFRWLAGRTPIARAGYGIHLYEITGDAEAHSRLAAIYRGFGLDGLADQECEKVSASTARAATSEPSVPLPGDCGSKVPPAG